MSGQPSQQFPTAPKTLAPGSPPPAPRRGFWDVSNDFSERVLDLMLGAVDVALGVAGAAFELGGMAREAAWSAWLNDRPRRLRERTARRRRWRRARDWRRTAVRIEMVLVAAFWVSKMVWKLTKPWVRQDIRDRAALGYRNGRQLTRGTQLPRAGMLPPTPPPPGTQQAGTQQAGTQQTAGQQPAGQGQPGTHTGQGQQRRTWRSVFFAWWSPTAQPQPQPQPQPQAPGTEPATDEDVQITITVSDIQDEDQTLESAAGLTAGAAAAPPAPDTQDVVDAEVVEDTIPQPPVQLPVWDPQKGDRFRIAGDRWGVIEDVATLSYCTSLHVQMDDGERGYLEIPHGEAPDGYAPRPYSPAPFGEAAPASADTAVAVSTTTPGTTNSLEGHTMTSNTIAANELSASAFGLGGELHNVSDLRREGQIVQQLVEQFNALGAIIVGFGTTLPERYQQAPFGTAKLTEAVNGIAENRNRAGDMGEYLGLLDSACAAAQGLGEHISAQRAEGDTSGFAQR